MRWLYIVVLTAVLSNSGSTRVIADTNPELRGTSTMGTTMNIDGRDYSVLIEPDVNARTESFNKRITSQGIKGEIVGCALLIDVPVGTAHGNHSYGGYCIFADGAGKRRNVEICNDEMVGQFQILTNEPITRIFRT